MPRSALLVVILPAIWCCKRASEWSELGSVGNGVLYITRDHQAATAITGTGYALIDFQSPQSVDSVDGAAPGRTYLSTKSEHEFDCALGQMRIHSVAYYAGHMGKGEAVFTTTKLDGWTAVQPGSTEKKIWDAVCTSS